MLPLPDLRHEKRDASASTALLATWLLIASIFGTAQGTGPLRRYARRFMSSPLGWGEYCDGTRWAYKTPQCGNSTTLDASNTKSEAGWPAFESACGGPGQSPVNINFLQTSFKSFGPIYFLGYNVPFHFNIENGGHALYITPLNAHLESYGGPLPARYNLSKGVFHFGNETSPRGSEHTIDERNYAAEARERMKGLEFFKIAECLETR
ncbi:carbonic anhydrase 12-like [Amblyomma americanum]